MQQVRQEPVPAWLQGHRVTIPGQPANFVHRPRLAARFEGATRVTVLVAPGGFGKTTLLAEGCRNLVDHGVSVAWLTADDTDDAQTLDTYLAHAFRLAGLDLVPALDGDLDSVSYRRTGTLVRAVEVVQSPCLLALDELERVVDPGAVACLNELLRNAPPRLRFVIACRALPPGLDLAEAMAAGEVGIVSADDLRFTDEDIDSFFDPPLSRRERDRLAAWSSGWPVALRVERNQPSVGAPGASLIVRDVIANWMRASFFRGCSAEDESLVLDASLFEVLDAELLDDVLEWPGAFARLEEVAALAGLLQPVGDGHGAALRMHPLLREHCGARLRAQSYERFRRVQRRIALALARRGRTVEAMRSATQADDFDLAGRILLDAGGIRIWLRDGSDRLIAADRLLTASTFETSPRLALVRCVTHALQGEHAAARRVYDQSLTEAGDGADAELAIDRCLAGALLCGGGATVSGVVEQAARIEELPGAEPIARASIAYWQCIGHSMQAEFPRAQECLDRAAHLVGGTSRYVTVAIAFQYGAMAMAQGRVDDATRHYREGMDHAKACFLSDPRQAVFGHALQRELVLEQTGRIDAQEAATVCREVYRCFSLFAAYAAAAEAAAESALVAKGGAAASATVDELRDRTRRMGNAALERLLSGLQVSVLVAGGDVDAAELAWRTAGLPDTDVACLDLRAQGWREMEAIASARIALLCARGEYEPGRRLAAAMRRLAVERGLRRTTLRALALAARVEWAAECRESAAHCLVLFLDLFQEVPYARAWVRERAGAAIIEDFLATTVGGRRKRAARQLLATQRARFDPQHTTVLTERELEVLGHMEMRRDAEIAAAMRLSRDGVRYHVQNIFRKLNVHSRNAAVHRARSLGLLRTQH